MTENPETEIKPYSKEWQAIANDLARDYTPSIRPCRRCAWPVISGYCCGGCGSDEP